MTAAPLQSVLGSMGEQLLLEDIKGVFGISLCLQKSPESASREITCAAIGGGRAVDKRRRQQLCVRPVALLCDDCIFPCNC